MLSTKSYNKKSEPIAVYKKNKKNNFVYITSKIDMRDGKDKEFKEYNKNINFKELEKLDELKEMKARDKVKTVHKLRDYFINNKKPVSGKMKDLYESAEKYMEDKTKDNITVSEKVSPIPPLDRRNVMYVAGPSGSGKSYFIAEYVERYHKMFPDNEIFLFSKKDEDPAFDEKEYVIRVAIDDEFVEEPPDWKEFEESLCIFDDTHSFRGKVGKVIRDLQIDILDLGRASNISIAITSHLVADYNKTKAILNETKAIVLYPELGNTAQNEYVMKKYMGMNKETIKKVKKLVSRWVYINRAPKYVVHDRGVFLY